MAVDTQAVDTQAIDTRAVGTETLGRLEELFERTARAVVAGQGFLEERQTPRAGRRVAARAVYSVPRVSLDYELAFEVTEDRRVLFKRRRTREALSHRVRFDLLAVPRPPPLPPAADDYERRILQPDFLLPVTAQADIRDFLARELRVAGHWTFRPRPAKDRLAEFQARVAAEGDAVRTSGALVCFRLPGSRVLVARVAAGSTGRKDGLFVVDPEAEVPVTIFNFDGDGTSGIRWEPLGLLAKRLRRWHAAGEPRESVETGLGPGFKGPRVFLEQLVEGLGRGLRYLAEAEEGEGPLPIFHDFDGVEAILRFAVREDDPRSEVMVTAKEAEDAPESVLRVTVEPFAAPPLVTVELAELEFVLAAGERRRAVDQLVAVATDVEKAMGVGTRRWIEDPQRRGRVVVLRWFDKTERLLAIWPAAAGNVIAFTCQRRKGTEIRSIERVTASGGAPSSLTDADTDVLRYRPFHRFFQAMLAWQRRGV